MRNLSDGRYLSFGDERAIVFSCLGETELQGYVACVMSRVRDNERSDAIIWGSSRLIDTQFEVANLVRIRYLGRGWDIEE